MILFTIEYAVMSLSKKFKTSADLEQGVPFAIEDAPNLDGTVPTFMLARASENNPAYAKVQDRVMAPYRKLMAKGDGLLPAAKFAELVREIFAEAGCVGWENVPAADVTGNETDTGYIKYSKQNAMVLFKNLPDLYAILADQATERSRYQEQEKAADAGN